jgi:hypothetical protein
VHGSRRKADRIDAQDQTRWSWAATPTTASRRCGRRARIRRPTTITAIEVRRLADPGEPGVGEHERHHGDAAGEIGRLKRASGGDIVQYGFGAVTRLMLEHGLLDELRRWLYPLILGQGRPADLLFGETRTGRLELTDTPLLADGIVILDYRFARSLLQVPRRAAAPPPRAGRGPRRRAARAPRPRPSHSPPRRRSGTVPGVGTHRPGLGHAAPERRRRGESCRSHPGAHGRVRAFTLVAGVRVGGGCGA